MRQKKSAWQRFVGIMLWIFTIVSALGLIAGSFGGNINPAEVKGICLMVMTLPGWIILMIIATVLDLFWCRKALSVCLLTFIACASAIWEFCPLNITKPSFADYEETPKFTLLTYNVTNFTDLSDKYPGGINPTASYILSVNADVVNIQEGIAMVPREKCHLTQAQIDSLHSVYPYIILCPKTSLLLSKYPAEVIHTGSKNLRGKEIAAVRLNIEGTMVTLFNVHLQCYQLSHDDKSLFKQITTIKDPTGDSSIKESARNVKSQLISKIQKAAEERADDCERLCRYVEHFGGPNVIIAGDFNDVPGCYTLRRLADFNFKQVYPEVSFGPMITFNRDRFYFRIDHILYRGALTPLRLNRGDIIWSDHYPLLATFAITPDKK